MKKNEKEQNKVQMSAPVISRSGKITRVSVSGKKETPVKEEPREELACGEVLEEGEKLYTDTSLSDGGFHRNGGKKKSRKKDTHTVKSTEKRPFPLISIISCAICTVLFMSLVVNFVQLNEFTKDISDLNGKVETMTKEKNDLEAELEEKNNVETLKNYLTARAGEMGMIEEGKMNPPVAVTPEKNETVKDYDVEEESDAIIVTVLNALGRNFSDVWDILTGNN